MYGLYLIYLLHRHESLLIHTSNATAQRCSRHDIATPCHGTYIPIRLHKTLIISSTQSPAMLFCCLSGPPDAASIRQDASMTYYLSRIGLTRHIADNMLYYFSCARPCLRAHTMPSKLLLYYAIAHSGNAAHQGRHLLPARRCCRDN